MKKYKVTRIVFFFAVIICLFNFAHAQTDVKLREQRELTIKRFAEVTHAYPIRIPLVYESDGGWSLLLVSNDSVNLGVDKVFLVNVPEPPETFSFNNDIFQVDSIKIVNQIDDGCQYMAVVSNIKDKIRKTVPIDGFVFHIIVRKINTDNYECPSRVRIPTKIVNPEYFD